MRHGLAFLRGIFILENAGMEPKTIETLKTLLLRSDSQFWDLLRSLSATGQDFDELFLLASLAKKAKARQVPRQGIAHEKTRLALMGGYSLYPFHELLEFFCDVSGFPCEVWLGDYDNYVSEIFDDDSGLYAFGPQVALLIPSELRCRYSGNLTDSRQAQQAEAEKALESLLEMAKRVHDKTKAEVILANFILPARHDLGTFRTRTLASDWTFRKWINLNLGLKAPLYFHICDLEFLAHRHGGMQARDDRAWFESKQPCSSSLLVEFAREAAHLIGSLQRAPKKVLVLDLDNTLWGGVVAEDGLTGIELGDTSPRGEAFKAFQKYILSLKQRGVLLAVASKNDHAKALEVFEKHPEMMLRMDDVVSFKANWEPKSDNIRQMAGELNLGLDSFVFVDDNPAEVEIVRQFAPDVTTILLGPDPSGYVGQLQDCRLFEPRNITPEDAERTNQYRSEAQRKALESSGTNMDSYLESLGMEGAIFEFTEADVPRLSQLINKSNQFNLTTRRRTEADLLALMNDSVHIGFSVRLKDRFGDHGLISVIIGRKRDETMEIDTWLMSCRVLKRQVEEEVLNELVRLAIKRSCSSLTGIYLPTAKNEMVRDFYPRMGFTLTSENENRREYELAVSNFKAIPTKIKVIRRAYEPS